MCFLLQFLKKQSLCLPSSHPAMPNPTYGLLAFLCNTYRTLPSQKIWIHSQRPNLLACYQSLPILVSVLVNTTFLLAGSALSSSVTRHSPSSPPAPLISPESCLDSHTTSKHWWGMFCKFQSSVLFLCHSTFTPPIIHVIDSHFHIST